MNALAQGLTSVGRSLLAAVWYVLRFQWIAELVELVRELIRIKRRAQELEDHRRGRDPHCAPTRCGAINPDVYRRADPLIYSQRYLREQGLAVTWDNPDIQMYRNGLPVSSSSLEAGTEYEIRAQIWNNSTDAPAVGLAVDFFFHNFGIGPEPIAIGSDTVTLPVKGALGHPAFATTAWTTPSEEGHYCVKVQLNWTDDANPRNNLGQENTNVGIASSPAIFRFPVRNEAAVRRTLRLVADAYEIPEQIECGERPKKKQSDREHQDLILSPAFIPQLEREADWTTARVRHGQQGHPIPPGWSIEFDQDVLHLESGEAEEVQVTITPPDDFVGQRPINVNAMIGSDLVGGVTLLVSSQEA